MDNEQEQEQDQANDNLQRALTGQASNAVLENAPPAKAPSQFPAPRPPKPAPAPSSDTLESLRKDFEDLKRRLHKKIAYL